MSTPSGQPTPGPTSPGTESTFSYTTAPLFLSESPLPISQIPTNISDPHAINITRLEPSQYPCAIPRLASLHEELVRDGSRLSFLLPTNLAKITAYWEGLTNSVLERKFIVFVAHDWVFPNPNFWGCVMLAPCQSDNALHRGEVWRLMVSTKARRKGVATKLMKAMEEHARSVGVTLLTLDTEKDSAGERFYERSGWERVGEIPGYGLVPDRSRLTDEVFYYKKLV